MQKELINVDEKITNINKSKNITQMLSKKSSNIQLIFSSGEELSFDKNYFLSLNPYLLNNNNLSIKNISENSFQINLPNYIIKEDLLFYISLIEKPPNTINGDIFFEKSDDKGNKTNKILNLLKISDYFCNEEFNVNLINYGILPFNHDNIIIDLLNYSYQKLCDYSEQKELVNNVYFDLFYKCLDNISKNENLVLKNLDRIKFLDKKIIDEIIDKTFQNLIYGNAILIEENNEINVEENTNKSLINEQIPQYHMLKQIQFKELIDFLMEIKKKKNFFELLTSEYAFLLSKESINELKNLPHPSLQVDIHFSDYSIYSQEFPLEIILNNKKIILVVSYKKFDQSFNVCIKLSNIDNKKKNCNSILEIDKISEEKYIEDNSCFKIFTFLAHVIITKGPERIKIATQNNLLSLSSNKNIYTILKISNFDNELRNFLIREPEKEYFSVIVQIKLCYLYSALASYLLNNFSMYSKDPNICKISKQLLLLILESKYLNIKDDNNIVETILLWLQDEVNINEDISSVFDLIKWENIEDDIMFELIVKYSHIITGNKYLEKKFIDAFEKKYKNSIITENILKSLFTAGTKIEYHKIFSQMKKSEKYNKSYKYFNSNSKLKDIFFINENSSLSKDSFSFKEGMQQLIEPNTNILMDKEKEYNNILFDRNFDGYNKDNTNENIIINQDTNKIDNNNNNLENTANKNSNNISLSTIKKNNEINKDLNKKNNTNKNTKKKNASNEQILFYKNNANFLKKNLSFINIKQQQKSPIKPNISKKSLKHNNIKKIDISYCKDNKNNCDTNNNKNNIGNVSININNISNINISNNNFSNYKTYGNNNFPKKKNDQSITLTIFSNKSQEKMNNSKKTIKKYGKKINNFGFKLFSSASNYNNVIESNISKNITKSGTYKINNNKKNSIQKTNKISNKYNNLLSTILNNDKSINKTKFGNIGCKNNVSIKKMIVNKNTKKLEKTE